jgi:hypothetical protein
MCTSDRFSITGRSIFDLCSAPFYSICNLVAICFWVTFCGILICCVECSTSFLRCVGGVFLRIESRRLDLGDISWDSNRLRVVCFAVVGSRLLSWGSHRLFFGSSSLSYIGSNDHSIVVSTRFLIMDELPRPLFWISLWLAQPLRWLWIRSLL